MNIYSFHKHTRYEYCETETYDICVNFSRLLSHVLLMIFMNIKCQWDLVMGKIPSLKFEVLMTHIRPMGRGILAQQNSDSVY